MRTAVLLFIITGTGAVHAQKPDLDQQPHFTRYTIVEDSDRLTPLAGKYVVHFIQRGTYWSYTDPTEPILGLPEKGMRLQPVLGAGYPALMATPARGTDSPDAKLVVLRGQDTMIVEIMAYYPRMGSLVNERCKHLDCTRRPPIVVPFRPGRYHPDGHAYGYDMNRGPDPRTVALTEQFDALWRKAMKDERVIPQLNTDTCRQEVVVPADLDRPETTMRDAWLMRSPYCGTHLVKFPSWGTQTEYIITFTPYLLEQARDPVHVQLSLGDHADGPLDITNWPAGDHQVQLLGDGNGGTFTLKLR
jgi:hypothetical protein